MNSDLADTCTLYLNITVYLEPDILLFIPDVRGQGFFKPTSRTIGLIQWFETTSSHDATFVAYATMKVELSVNETLTLAVMQATKRKVIGSTPVERT